ncbi:hypothetical protein DFS34DRAFT_602884 [Phlyctochytrium arcticum]|nr:hypothetical protein DFS34DRAFT_602884 [Phlyctochytrium arcticum]
MGVPLPSTTSKMECQLPGDHYLKAVSQSCRELLGKSAPDILLVEDKIDPFLQSINEESWSAAQEHSVLRLPLKFDTKEQELNVLTLIDILDFGSGWNSQLNTVLGRSVLDAVRFGVMSMHISSVKISATYLRDIRLSDVSTLFDIPLTRDVPHETLPLTISEPHSLRPFAQQLTDVMNEIGKTLCDRGYPDFAHFLLEIAQAGGATAEQMVQGLVKMFSAMRDAERFQNIDTYLFRKAQLITANLYDRFRDSDPARFNFSDVSSLTLLGDSAVCMELISRGILEVSESLREQLVKSEDLASSVDRWDLRLRAAAVAAGEAIVGRAKESTTLPAKVRSMTARELDTYLRQTSCSSQDALSPQIVNRVTTFA